MKLQTFVETYNLHDSYFTRIQYDEVNRILDMSIEFSFWMQKDFIEGSAEEGVLQLTFTNVSEYRCSDGDPCGYFVGILESRIVNNTMIISLMDDDENHYFEMKITAEDVSVKEIPGASDNS